MTQRLTLAEQTFFLASLHAACACTSPRTHAIALVMANSDGASGDFGEMSAEFLVEWLLCFPYGAVRAYAEGAELDLLGDYAACARSGGGFADALRVVSWLTSTGCWTEENTLKAVKVVQAGGHTFQLDSIHALCACEKGSQLATRLAQAQGLVMVTCEWPEGSVDGMIGQTSADALAQDVSARGWVRALKGGGELDVKNVTVYSKEFAVLLRSADVVVRRIALGFVGKLVRDGCQRVLVDFAKDLVGLVKGGMEWEEELGAASLCVRYAVYESRFVAWNPLLFLLVRFKDEKV